MPGALGCSVVPEVSRITFPVAAGVLGPPVACAATSFSTFRSWSSSVHATIWCTRFSASAIHRRAELFVIDDSVDAFAGNHLGQCRTGEGVLGWLRQSGQRIDEAAMIAAHDTDDPGGSGCRGA